MTEVVDFTARRWNTVDNSTNFKPLDALREAIRMIESGEYEADQVVVCFGRRTDDGGSGQTFAQAGSYTFHEALGLVTAVQYRMMVSGE